MFSSNDPNAAVPSVPAQVTEKLTVVKEETTNVSGQKVKKTIIEDTITETEASNTGAPQVGEPSAATPILNQQATVQDAPSRWSRFKNALATGLGNIRKSASELRDFIQDFIEESFHDFSNMWAEVYSEFKKFSRPVFHFVSSFLNKLTKFSEVAVKTYAILSGIFLLVSNILPVALVAGVFKFFGLQKLAANIADRALIVARENIKIAAISGVAVAAVATLTTFSLPFAIGAAVRLVSMPIVSAFRAVISPIVAIYGNKIKNWWNGTKDDDEAEISPQEAQLERNSCRAELLGALAGVALVGPATGIVLTSVAAGAGAKALGYGLDSFRSFRARRDGLAAVASGPAAQAANDLAEESTPNSQLPSRASSPSLLV